MRVHAHMHTSVPVSVPMHGRVRTKGLCSEHCCDSSSERNIYQTSVGFLANIYILIVEEKCPLHNYVHKPSSLTINIISRSLC